MADFGVFVRFDFLAFLGRKELVREEVDSWILAVVGHDRQALDLRDPTAERMVSLAFTSVRPDWPEWEFQAASPTSVARIALLPWPRLETDGTTTDLPTAHPATDFGFEPFLRTWWDDVRGGRDDRPDDDFVDVLLRSLELLSS